MASYVTEISCIPYSVAFTYARPRRVYVRLFVNLRYGYDLPAQIAHLTRIILHRFQLSFSLCLCVLLQFCFTD